MALEFIVVQYPEKREVFIDGQLCGLTDATLYIQTGTHRFHLGEPKKLSSERNRAKPSGIRIH